MDRPTQDEAQAAGDVARRYLAVTGQPIPLDDLARKIGVPREIARRALHMAFDFPSRN